MKRLVDLAWVFFWISTVTFGGGYAMVPLFEHEIVIRQRWKKLNPIWSLAVSALLGWVLFLQTRKERKYGNQDNEG